MKNLLPGILSVLLITACATVEPEPPACPTVPEVTCPVCPEVLQCPQDTGAEEAVPTASVEKPIKTAGDLQLPIIGAVEWVLVEAAGIRMESRIDTGAESSSIHAENIELLERDGKRFVRFDLQNPETGESIPTEHRFRRRVLIKQAAGELERRYVVRMWIALGETRARIDVTLTDRSDLDYPVLIGRNFLTDQMIVDVSQHHVLGR